MKIFIAQLATETNTFAPFPTGWNGFEENGIFRGDASRREPTGAGGYLAALRRLAEADGHEVVEGLCAFAQPAGRTVRAVYEGLRKEILSAVEAAMPVDAVILMLHGAMAAGGVDDCEGDLLARVRALVGPVVPIGVGLDLHCHFTRQMMSAADVIVSYKEYPHVDGVDRAAEIYRMTVDTAAGRIRPVMAAYDCRMVGLWYTTAEPMKGFVAHMQALEGRDGVLSVSLGHGFPWGDVPESGAKVWVVADGDRDKAAAVAAAVGRAFWDLREATSATYMTVDQALDRVAARDGGPVVLADVADKPGGGAPSDSTFVLRRLIERGVGDAVTGCYWDLGAIQICRDAGVGATLDLRIGGKFGPMSGDPIDVTVTVTAVVDGHSQAMLGRRAPLGTAVRLTAANGLDIVLASHRSQVFGTDAFTGLGIDLTAKKLIVVKSTQHFHAAFAPIAREILYVTTPGAVSPDFTAIPYRVRDLDYWPRVAQPAAR